MKNTEDGSFATVIQADDDDFELFFT